MIGAVGLAIITYDRSWRNKGVQRSAGLETHIPDSSAARQVDTPPQTPSSKLSFPQLAVTPHMYDDMGKFLTTLGINFSKVPLEALEDISKLDGYDVLFLTCGLTLDIG